MKKKCKNVNLTDWQVVLPWVTDCVMRHKKRYDFKKLLLRHGVSRADYYYALETFEYDVFTDAIEQIAKEASESIKKRKLNLPPVHIRKMIDTTTGKVRDIGKESAMQQVFDHIAVGSCSEIFRCRMVEQQMSSIRGRGQVQGVRLIRDYICEDNKAINYARKHKLRYSSKCKYFVKLDIRKCYPSADMDIFMSLLEHDCGNADIIWLWRTLLESHHVDGYAGFMIGALPSQWACQIMLSYIYRYAMELTYKKRGKDLKKVSHMVLFMDDMLLFGSNRRELYSAVKNITEYAWDKLGFTIKGNFAVQKLGGKVGVDMMGFVVYRNGKIEIRERNYIKSRRMIFRYYSNGCFVFSQAQRLASFKGYYKHSDSRKVSHDLKVGRIFRYCSNLISLYIKEKHNAKDIFHDRTRSGFVPADK